MKDKLSILNNDTINSQDLQATNKKTLSITFLRVLVCLAIITAVLILKIANPHLFLFISNWYKKNFLFEDEKIREIFISLKNFFLNWNSSVPEIQAFLNDFKF